MKKTESKKLQRYAEGGIQYIATYGNTDPFPEYLKEEFDTLYQYKCSKNEYYKIVVQEANAHRIKPSEKKESYKLWFGKYSGELLFNIEDHDYLVFLRDVFRNKNPKLVGQVLLRLDEI